jgi:hypothetical protein
MLASTQAFCTVWVEVAVSKLPRGCQGEREGRLSSGDEEYSSPATVLITQDAYLIG